MTDYRAIKTHFTHRLIMVIGAAAGAAASLLVVPQAALFALPLGEYGMLLAMIGTIILGAWLGWWIARRAIGFRPMNSK